jgi:hypothetical protein
MLGGPIQFIEHTRKICAATLSVNALEY